MYSRGHTSSDEVFSKILKKPSIVQKKYFHRKKNICIYIIYMYHLVPAAEIRDHETGLVSSPFSWFQSRQSFLETHETEANSIFYS